MSNRLGVVFLLFLSVMMLVAAIPVSTAQNVEKTSTLATKLSKTKFQELKMTKLLNVVDSAEEKEREITKAQTMTAEKVTPLCDETSIEEKVTPSCDEISIEETVTTVETAEILQEEISQEEILEEEISEIESSAWEGEVLNAYNGVVYGPSGRETYYNLPMGGVIEIMESLGYDYEYSVREDGVKMYGPYVMCAANLEIRPKGTILETSLGTAIVCDTGGFAENDPTQLDIAVDW